MILRSPWAGLGALPYVKNVQAGPPAAMQLAPYESTPIPGTCTPDGTLIWLTTPDGTLYASALRVGEVCQGTSGTNATKNVHNADGSTTVTSPDGVVTTIPPAVNQSSGVPGPITVIYDFDLGSAASTDPADASKSLKVGPFLIPLGAQSFTIHWSGLLPEDWRTFIIPELAHDCSNCIFSSMQDATPGTRYGVLRDFLGPGMSSQVNQDLVSVPQQDIKFSPGSSSGLVPQVTVLPILHVKLPDQPIAVVSRPDKGGENWGMFMVVLPSNPSYPWDAITNPDVLTFYWLKQPQGVWDWIKHIVGEIVDAVVKELCTLLPTASKVPNPYVAAGAVVLKLTGACDQSCPEGMTYHDDLKICACPPGLSYDSVSKTCKVMPPVVAPTNYVPWIIGGLVAIGAVLLLTKKPSTAG